MNSLFKQGKQKRFDLDVHEYMKQVVEELDDGKFSKLLKSDTRTKVSEKWLQFSYYLNHLLVLHVKIQN